MAMAPGYVVRLKSGGPLMTVRFHVGGDAAYWTGRQIGVWCNWHSDDGTLREGVFSEEQLVVMWS